MKTSVLKFGIGGLLAGFCLFLASLLLGKNLDFGTQEALGYGSMILALSLIFFAMRSGRRNEKGRFGFRKAFLLGARIAVLTALGVALADLLYTSQINPAFFEEYEALMRAQGYEGEIPQYGSGTVAFLMFITVLFLGLVISLLCALLLRNKNE